MKKYFTAALFILMAGAVCSAQSDQSGSPSLADIARNNQHQKAVLVVNEDTISSISGTVSVVGDESAPTSDSVSAAPASAKPSAQKSPAVASDGNAQVVELKKQLDTDKQELNSWQQSAKHYEELLSKETDDFRRETYKQALANDKTNVTQVQQKIDDVQAQLAKAQASAVSPSTAGQSAAGQTPANTQPPPSQQ